MVKIGPEIIDTAFKQLFGCSLNSRSRMTQDKPAKRPAKTRLQAMEHGRLAAKAEILKQMLAEDTERILRFIDKGNDLNEVPVGGEDGPAPADE
jgi:hypothetical protein